MYVGTIQIHIYIYIYIYMYIYNIYIYICMHKRFLESCSDETKNNVPDPVLVDRAVLGQWAAVSWTQAFDASEGIFPVIDGVCGQFDDFVQQAIWFLIDGFHQADRIDKIRCCHFSSVCLHHLISSSVPFTNRILQLPKT